MHNHNEILTLCKEREWKSLRRILNSNTTEIKYRILASAVFETYNATSQSYNGLGARWGKKNLSTGKQRFFSAFMDNAADLTDFYHAYIIAKNELRDFAVAGAIKTYIQANQAILGKLLESYTLPEALKAELCVELGLAMKPEQTPLVPPNSPDQQDESASSSEPEDEAPRSRPC